MKSNSIVFNNLRAEMSRKNITIKDLADEFGCTRDTMSSWLSMKRKISLDVAFQIQHKFFPETSIWELFEELHNEEQDKAG